jgi:hypothetical protein
VVRDEDGRELYREGPLDGFKIGRRVSTVAAEITREDREAFMRRQHVENAQLGPVKAPNGELRFPDLAYLRAWAGTAFRRRGRE